MFYIVSRQCTEGHFFKSGAIGVRTDRVLEHEDSTRSMKLMHEYFNRVSDRHYDCADTEVEIHMLHLFNVAHEFDAGEYVEAIEASKNINS